MQAGMMQGGQGMMSSMYNQQAMAHLPQLAQPHMGGNMMGYGPMMPQQQGFGNMNPGQGALLLTPCPHAQAGAHTFRCLSAVW